MTLRLVRVGDLAEQIRGVSFDKGEADGQPGPGRMAVLRAGNITDEGLRTDRDLIYVPDGRISEKQKLRVNDVVIAASSGSLAVVGKAARLSESFEGSFGAFCKVLRPGPDIEPRYFAHYFRTPEYRRRVARLAAGANINNLKNEHLDDTLMPTPEMEQQRRIADVLDRADDLRAKRRAALEQLETLKQSIFLDMFGDPMRNPRGWGLRPIGDLGHVVTGRTPPTSEEGMFEGTTPFVTPGDLEGEADVKRSLTPAGVAKSVVVRAGSALLCCIGATIGKCGVALVDSAFNQQINAVEWGGEVNDFYGLFVLRGLKNRIVMAGTSTTMPIFKKSSLERLHIPVPPADLQSIFSRRLAAAEMTQVLRHQSMSRLDELFSCIQQRAFAGAL